MPTIRAPAKINLFLHITGRRDDGYHFLDSLTVFAHGLCDIISIEPAGEFSLTVTGPFAHVVPADNLVIRAVNAMEGAYDRKAGVKILLEKNIPAGAGLGGGSADAAATVKGLERLWGAAPDEEARDSLLLSLGADVPVCYRAAPCRFRGIGDIIEDVPPLPPLFALIVWPGAGSETKAVFQERTSAFGKEAEFPASFDTAGNFIRFLAAQHNGLTDAATALNPATGDALRHMAAQENCLLARMSGSGSSVFGLFLSEKEAEAARNSMDSLWFTAISTV